ncbi:dipicolinic acid synthetase subunit A [Alteribacillus iranensis]|uniref:Dipicolinate synthase subunit A n=1 Tax=Alteribacillus iranensis TaxID=930128 RepID=A0A1I2A2A4_9BACI|nr:dipicolinic acid synthetase subunit A [Alteribacillus iranensis]SFE38051.1 dipicolinate synthase subunit A [Alteribacillus iranensis]
MAHKKIVVLIGGDARQSEIAEQCLARNMKVYMIGFDQWERNTAGIIKATGENDIPWQIVDVLLLPVSGLKEGNKVEAQFSSSETVIKEEWLRKTKNDCLLVTGIDTEPLKKLEKRIKRKWIRLIERDDVSIYNSIPSAEGTLLMALQETDITIHQSHTIVLGLGRTGQTIANTFSSLGAYVKVGTVNPAEKARAEAMGLEVFDLKDLASVVEKVDICINTIPAGVITKKELVHFPHHALIIDVASYPGGTDFTYAKQRGIKAMLAPGLPGAVAPRTAGQILAKVVFQLLEEQVTEKEDENAFS